MSTSDTSRSVPLRAGNARIKRLRRLVSQSKARSRERAFVVEGPSLVAEAVDAAIAGRLRLDEIFVAATPPSGSSDRSDSARSGPGADAQVQNRADVDRTVVAAAAVGVPVHAVVEGLLETVLDPVNPQPIAAVVERPVPDPSAIQALDAERLVLCLVEARDPGNVGTLMRSAEAAGAAGLVLAGPSVDPTNPKSVRASAGAVLRLPVVEVAAVGDALDALAAAGRILVATILGPEAIPYDRVRLVDAAVLLGNEAHGLPESVVARADLTATIPLAGPTESLNLAVAGSLFCFEALRQARYAAEHPDR